MKIYPFLFLLLACQKPPCYPANGRYDYTKYKQNPTTTSPQYGIGIDDPKEELNLARLDRTIEATLECVQRVWPEMTKEDQQTGWCTGTPVLEIKSCLIIQVPPDWHHSPCTGAELFNCSVPNASCHAKGLNPTPECPCSCRSMMQGQNTLLTTPNLELFPARLTELLTGCDQIWQTPLAACGSTRLVNGGLP